MRHEVDKSTLEVIPILFPIKDSSSMGMRLEWSCNLGWGQYDLVFNEDGSIEGYSECMDNNDDKKFITTLLEKMIEKINIID